MASGNLKSALLQVHRWLALALAPLFILILLTGAVLAFKPIVADLAPPPADMIAVPASTIVELLDRVDPQGRAQLVTVSPDGRTATVQGPPAKTTHTYELASGAEVATPDAGFDLFAFAKSLHKDLLIGAGVVVEIAAWAMVLIVVSGPLLAWPRLRHTLAGWHMGIGWILFPLVLMIPLTGGLMALHIGGPALPAIDPAAPRVALARAIEQAEADGVDAIAMARRFRGSAAMVSPRVAGEFPRVVTSDREVSAITDPGLAKSLHEGIWAGGWSGALNLFGALALAGLVGTGTLAWYRRWRLGRTRSGAADADILVAFASQTGTAAKFAAATHDALAAAGGRVASMSLAAVAPRELVAFRRVLLIASTTGEGEVPDQGKIFLARLDGARLDGVSFALLALGDRSYAQFCGGGERLRDALVAAGATEAMPPARADREPAPAWREWLHDAAAGLGLDAPDVAAPEPDRAVGLTLVERTQLNDPADPETGEAWGLVFESAEPLDFRPGDLVLVPAPDGGPDRPYSVGSSSLVDPRRIRLTVALKCTRDAAGREQFGLVSHRLDRELAIGDRLDAKLRRHPDFNPPESPRPLILVSAGCGVAPFIGFLEEHERRRLTTPTWLVFGNRKRAGDYLYREELDRWQRGGQLARVDTAFSRDGDGYVQDRLLAAQDEVFDWLARRDAMLYVCGRASTIGKGVRDALAQIVAKGERISLARAEERIERWAADGKLRFDLFA